MISASAKFAMNMFVLVRILREIWKRNEISYKDWFLQAINLEADVY